MKWKNKAGNEKGKRSSKQRRKRIEQERSAVRTEELNKTKGQHGPRHAKIARKRAGTERVAKTNGGKVQRARETNMGPPEPYQKLKIKAQTPIATYDAQTEARKKPAQC